MQKILKRHPPGETNLQSKQDLICHVAKVKVAMLTHSMADLTPFLAYLLFRSKTTLKPKETIFYTQQRKQFSVFISHVIKTKNRNRSINKMGYDR